MTAAAAAAAAAAAVARDQLDRAKPGFETGTGTLGPDDGDFVAFLREEIKQQLVDQNSRASLDASLLLQWRIGQAAPLLSQAYTEIAAKSARVSVQTQLGRSLRQQQDDIWRIRQYEILLDNLLRNAKATMTASTDAAQGVAVVLAFLLGAAGAFENTLADRMQQMSDAHIAAVAEPPAPRARGVARADAEHERYAAMLSAAVGGGSSDVRDYYTDAERWPNALQASIVRNGYVQSTPLYVYEQIALAASGGGGGGGDDDDDDDIVERFKRLKMSKAQLAAAPPLVDERRRLIGARVLTAKRVVTLIAIGQNLSMKVASTTASTLGILRRVAFATSASLGAATSEAAASVGGALFEITRRFASIAHLDDTQDAAQRAVLARIAKDALNFDVEGEQTARGYADSIAARVAAMPDAEAAAAAQARIVEWVQREAPGARIANLAPLYDELRGRPTDGTLVTWARGLWARLGGRGALAVPRPIVPGEASDVGVPPASALRDLSSGTTLSDVVQRAFDELGPEEARTLGVANASQPQVATALAPPYAAVGVDRLSGVTRALGDEIFYSNQRAGDGAQPYADLSAAAPVVTTTTTTTTTTPASAAAAAAAASTAAAGAAAASSSVVQEASLREALRELRTTAAAGAALENEWNATATRAFEDLPPNVANALRDSEMGEFYGLLRVYTDEAKAVAADEQFVQDALRADAAVPVSGTNTPWSELIGRASNALEERTRTTYVKQISRLLDTFAYVELLYAVQRLGRDWLAPPRGGADASEDEKRGGLLWGLLGLHNSLTPHTRALVARLLGTAAAVPFGATGELAAQLLFAANTGDSARNTWITRAMLVAKMLIPLTALPYVAESAPDAAAFVGGVVVPALQLGALPLAAFGYYTRLRRELDIARRTREVALATVAAQEEAAAEAAQDATDTRNPGVAKDTFAPDNFSQPQMALRRATDRALAAPNNSEFLQGARKRLVASERKSSARAERATSERTARTRAAVRAAAAAASTPSGTAGAGGGGASASRRRRRVDALLPIDAAASVQQDTADESVLYVRRVYASLQLR